MIHLLDNNTQRLLQSSIQIQSPVTVLKELLDNAVDANSTEIQVILTNCGIDEIMVQDNGCGISKENLKILGNKRATSKDQHTDSSGFRGEALYVIASVAEVSIQSKVENQQGNMLILNQDICETMCNEGTTVVGPRIAFLNQEED
ncbi:DNA_mismatch repair protein MutL [Hexamita inflata]|uniref:DNA mismatch repair protein MutL n=1 Tax=Hexamita inflata TaxID=28002 RepID=A0AA86Q630_9EUKA|nr:DNA mismatch repair protein MutL [Hexamita inflata]CAI9950238.1 DNA mismatch repair protein MutL [Hexamita inflata]